MCCYQFGLKLVFSDWLFETTGTIQSCKVKVVNLRDATESYEANNDIDWIIDRPKEHDASKFGKKASEKL